MQKHELVWSSRNIILLHMAFPDPFDLGFRLERGDGRRKGCRVDKPEGKRPRRGRAAGGGGGGTIGVLGGESRLEPSLVFLFLTESTLR
jgi:hypothetical protein